MHKSILEPKKDASITSRKSYSMHMKKSRTQKGGRYRHMMSKTPEYLAWRAMKCRCNSDNPNYGARGIRVCQRWINSFELFYEDIGPRPSASHSIDRFPNNNGNYEPGNVRWATRKQQQSNMRKNIFFTFSGETLHLRDWESRTGVDHKVLKNRIRLGLPPEQIFFRGCLPSWRRKLSREAVLYIRQQGKGSTTLAKKFSVSKPVIQMILQGKTYRDVI